MEKEREEANRKRFVRSTNNNNKTPKKKSNRFANTDFLSAKYSTIHKYYYDLRSISGKRTAKNANALLIESTFLRSFWNIFSQFKSFTSSVSQQRLSSRNARNTRRAIYPLCGHAVGIHIQRKSIRGKKFKLTSIIIVIIPMDICSTATKTRPKDSEYSNLRMHHATRKAKDRNMSICRRKRKSHVLPRAVAAYKLNKVNCKLTSTLHSLEHTATTSTAKNRNNKL